MAVNVRAGTVFMGFLPHDIKNCRQNRITKNRVEITGILENGKIVQHY